MYGFAHPTISRLILELPGAEKCARFVGERVLNPNPPHKKDKDKAAKGEAPDEAAAADEGGGAAAGDARSSGPGGGAAPAAGSRHADGAGREERDVRGLSLPCFELS
jgi:hypothetical protein